MADEAVAAGVSIDRSTGDEVLRIIGDWTLVHAATIDQRLREIHRGTAFTGRYDFSGLRRLDTVGAQLLLELCGSDPDAPIYQELDESQRKLLTAVAAASQPSPSSADGTQRWTDMLARIGASM